MNQFADVTLVLDCSSSMTGIWSSTIDGINGLIAEQRKAHGELVFSVLTFSSEIKWERIATPIQKIGRIGEREFQLRTGTRLNDALGEAITTTTERISKAHPNNPPRVLIAVMTDGFENASQNFTRGQIFKMILDKRRNAGWEFLFLGANQDAIQSAVSLGIPATHALDFTSTNESAQGATGLLDAEITKFTSGMATGFFPSIEEPPAGTVPEGDTGHGT